MLSAFQEAAQTAENKDENALVPFYRFYDTVHTFLESAIRLVIDRCQKAAEACNGLEQQDVDVLKLSRQTFYIQSVQEPFARCANGVSIFEKKNNGIRRTCSTSACRISPHF